MRKVKALKEAKWIEAPVFKEGPKSAAQKKGLQYERRVQRILKHLYGNDYDVRCNPWISFRDFYGSSVCSPDLIMVPNSADKPIIIVEVKLTRVKGAKGKLKSLYGKLVAHIMERSVALVQIYKNKGNTKAEEEIDIQEFAKIPRARYVECHWL